MKQTQNTEPVFDVGDFGAAGDGTRMDTASIQAAIDKAASTVPAHRTGSPGDRVRVRVPAGRYLVAPIELRSGVELWLDAGATLIASQEISDFPVIVSRWEGSTRQTYAPLVFARNAVNIALSGEGTIDGRGQVWWQLFRQKKLEYPRPRLIGFSDCEKVLIEGLRLENSPSWTVNPVRCSDVTVRKLSIFNPPDSPNTDGINPDSCDGVLIEDCHVSVGDDCVTLKSGTELEAPEYRAPLRNVIVRNCLLERGHGAVVIGSEMSGGVSNVRVENCRFVGTDRGIRMKSRRGRGGLVENVSISGIEMRDVLCPFTMNLYYGCGAWGDPVVGDKGSRPVGEGTPAFRNILVRNVKAVEARYAAAFLYGLPESPIRNLTIENYEVWMAPAPLEKSEALSGAGTVPGNSAGVAGTVLESAPDPQTAADPMPDGDAGYPEMADGIPLMSREGFFARNVDGLSLRNVKVNGQQGPAFLIEDCRVDGEDFSR